MNKKESISDFLDKKPETKLVQAFVNFETYQVVKRILKVKKITIKSLVEASFKKFIEENKDCHHAGKK